MKYSIVGSSMQSLDIELEEGEKIYGDSGKLEIGRASCRERV